MHRFLVAALLGLSLPQGAGAAEIGIDLARENGCLGQQSCRLGPARLSAGPGAEARLIEQTYREVSGIGIALIDTAADRDREIQGPVLDKDVLGERLTLTLDRARAIEAVTVAHLFNPSVPGDPAELAIIEGFRDGVSLGAIRLRNEGEAESGFSASGAAFDGVERVAQDAGVFVLTTPFGGPVDSVVFTAGAVSSGDSSDYSLVSVLLAD